MIHLGGSRQRLAWMVELARCERDPAYLAEHHLTIKSKDVIGRPPLRFNVVQRYVLDRMRDQWQRTGFVRQIVGKARQVGLSTLCRALAFHQFAFQSNRNTLLVAHDESSTQDLFEHDKGFYESLPQPFKLKNVQIARFRMTAPSRNSFARANHALNMNVGASQMTHFLHMTEVSRFRNAETIQAALFPALSDARDRESGFLQAHSVAVMESTAVFGGTWFKDFAEAAQRGEAGGWEFVFIPWWMMPGYQETPPKGFQPDAEEREWLREHPDLTLANLYWRRRKREEYRSNPILLNQEFPFSWQDAWVLPKGANRVFTPDQCAEFRMFVRPGVLHEPTSTGLKEQFGGRLEVWEEPQPGVFYDIGVDVAEGRTEGADWTVVSVVRRDTLEQVAEYRAHIEPSSVELLDLVYWTGIAYNVGQIVVDITGGWGHFLLAGLQKRGYGNLWQDRSHTDAQERAAPRVGFLYTKPRKRYLVYNAAGLAARGGLVVRSRALLGEMETFLNVGIDEWQAMPPNKDDCVNAWMLALLSARDEGGTEAVARPVIEVKRPKYETEPWSYMDVDEALTAASVVPLIEERWRR